MFIKCNKRNNHHTWLWGHNRRPPVIVSAQSNKHPKAFPQFVEKWAYKKLNRNFIWLFLQAQTSSMMKLNKSTLYSFLLLIVVAAVYRVLPRPEGLWGFAPQIAMAIFGGSVIKDKKMAFLLPLLSMFISDTFFQLLYSTGIGQTPGFYSGQLTNYILFGLLTVVGFFINQKNVLQIGLGAVAAPVIYFLLSNLQVWIGGGGWHRPKTFVGLMMSYTDGLPFFKGSLMGTLFFALVLFGGYYLITKKDTITAKA